jgi:hypothetical protein
MKKMPSANHWAGLEVKKTPTAKPSPKAKERKAAAARYRVVSPFSEVREQAERLLNADSEVEKREIIHLLLLSHEELFPATRRIIAEYVRSGGRPKTGGELNALMAIMYYYVRNKAPLRGRDRDIAVADACRRFGSSRGEFRRLEHMRNSPKIADNIIKLRGKS